MDGDVETPEISLATEKHKPQLHSSETVSELENNAPCVYQSKFEDRIDRQLGGQDCASNDNQPSSHDVSGSRCRPFCQSSLVLKSKYTFECPFRALLENKGIYKGHDHGMSVSNEDCLELEEEGVSETSKADNNANPPDEAIALAMDSSARAALNSVGSFVGTYIVVLAAYDVGCVTPIALCTLDNSINKYSSLHSLGLRPSSLLTAASVIVGVTVSILMPVIGAIVDRTRHRKLIGSLTAYVTVTITLIQALLIRFRNKADTWLSVWILEMVGGLFFLSHLTVAMAYLSDLVRGKSNELRNHVTSRIAISNRVSTIIFVGITLIYGVSSKPNPKLNSAAFSSIIAFAVSAPLMVYAWTFLFKKRDSLTNPYDYKDNDTNPSECTEKDKNSRRKSEKRKLFSSLMILFQGLIQLKNTIKKLVTTYRSLRWLMLTFLFSPEAGAGVTLTITTTYLAAMLNMSSNEVGLAFLAVLFSSVLSAYFAKNLMNRIDPLNTFRIGTITFGLVWILAPVILDGPENKKLSYLIGVLFGIPSGLLYPCQSALQVSLIPPGQEVEFMGIFTFCNQIIGWLPPLIFTIMNENGVNMRLSFGTIAAFPILSFFLSFGIGNFNDAMAEAIRHGKN
mmetsp:Transcript_7984/g.11395  ORF Transcript_7984/g.11395 Transcript_7984/m.11395 type:complete len:623 (+) Transcript_7984:114-1982(+)|eukprot:CAMPEP_0184868364 /NCGR_PEP_ID=MMETSP0580-20130426/30217_1 /TAXON_ID=1118495 /ORGANISM="Dactyliosolen fragilissimus" /LENGTH=622 /DNA_ID=CAMNT_0027369209 /DNA_START=97 /DNA_END=1965 /DNA_ORIENTATION=-